LLGASQLLLDATEAGRRPVRLLGVTCSSLEARVPSALVELDLEWPDNQADGEAPDERLSFGP
jgi:hypothetical protein